jgi:hypothetical protein
MLMRMRKPAPKKPAGFGDASKKKLIPVLLVVMGLAAAGMIFS